jgi:hypothetical protein
MELKGTYQTRIGFQSSGRFFIEQYSESHNDMDIIFLSPDQFRQIYHWFSENECEIEEAWKGGVE